MSSALARALLGGPPSGRGVSAIQGGTCTAWDGVTYENVVVASSTTFTNLPVLDPAGMSTGLVLLAFSPAGPIILGRLYQANT